MFFLLFNVVSTVIVFYIQKLQNRRSTMPIIILAFLCTLIKIFFCSLYALVSSLFWQFLSGCERFSVHIADEFAYKFLYLAITSSSSGCRSDLICSFVAVFVILLEEFGSGQTNKTDFLKNLLLPTFRSF